ncbi:hypothetical protein EV426DRAFT_540876 [Tirmania nivea]|nr:hypothetical protein EV426DRAFT_540876 [Tirmania nivea]
MSEFESARSLLIPIVRQNLTEIGSVLTQHINDGATSSSVLLSPADIPTTLDRTDCPSLPPYTIRVINTDVLTAAISILGVEKASHNETIVLSACSDERPGGSYTDLISSASTLPAHPLPPTPSIPPEWQLHATQEESLCLATTLHTTLNHQNHQWYPWPSAGPGSIRGIYSPGVVIFRDPCTLTELPHSQRHVVSVLSLAQLKHRPLTPDGSELEDEADLDVFRRRIRLWLRTAAMNGQERLVLGDCNSDRLPPGLAARELKAALADEEFRGWFREVVFAIREGSFEAYSAELDGVVV